MTLRDLLNRALWRDGDMHALQIRVAHRGAPGDERVVGGSRVVEVNASGVLLAPDTLLAPDKDGEGIFLPYHRFLSVSRDDQVLWDPEIGFVDAPSAASELAMTADSHHNPVRTEVRVAKSNAPLVLDGSAGEGGGQILRSSLALSVLTGTPFVLEDIRAGRRTPGLARQHLTCVRAAAAICGADVEGDQMRSTRLSFAPGARVGGDHCFEIGSAGSVGLVLQTIALPLALGPHAATIEVHGGTHAKWAPPLPFLQEAWLPLVQAMGADLRLEMIGAGFYPAGGGRVRLHITPTDALEPIDFGHGGAMALEAQAVVSNLGEGIARRQLAAAAESIGDTALRMKSATLRSNGPGNAIWISAVRERGATNVFSAFGDRGVEPEDVGHAVAAEFLRFRDLDVAIGPHLCDQLMLPIALAGSGEFTTAELTLHSWTNLAVIEAFTGQRFEVDDLGAGRFRVKL